MVFREGVKASPRSFTANYQLGKLLLGVGRLEEAETFLLAAMALYPKFSRTYYLLGRLRQKQDSPEDAQSYMATFQELDRVSENRVFPLTDW